MHKAIEWFLWGLPLLRHTGISKSPVSAKTHMGMGWAISNNVLNFIAQFIHGH